MTGRDHSRRGRATRLHTARVPRRRRRAAEGPASIEEEKPSAEIACNRVDGRRLDWLCKYADPSDHVEEARGWWNSDASKKVGERVLAVRAALGEGGAAKGEDEEAANDDERHWLQVRGGQGPR
ncbi:hypothetical protein BHM03_00027369 [Ensete ventricosum]|nr:hypothetical protein BHM03_00027369 [Ensete ventricosum]